MERDIDVVPDFESFEKREKDESKLSSYWIIETGIIIRNVSSLYDYNGSD
jgi:hypothetical protein